MLPALSGCRYRTQGGYCLKVTQAIIATVRPAEAEAAPATAGVEPGLKRSLSEGLRDANDRLNRLQLYLVPRMQGLEPMSVIGAMKRGETDGARYNEAIGDIANRW